MKGTYTKNILGNRASDEYRRNVHEKSFWLILYDFLKSGLDFHFIRFLAVIKLLLLFITYTDSIFRLTGKMVWGIS